MNITPDEIMDFIFGKSIQIALLIVLALPYGALAQQHVPTTCEAKAPTLFNGDSDTKFTVTGTVVSFTISAKNPLFDALVGIYGNEERRVIYNKWGCTEELFISAKTGEVVKRIDIVRGLPTACVANVGPILQRGDDSGIKGSVAGTAVSFTGSTENHSLESFFDAFSRDTTRGSVEALRETFKKGGCTEVLFISAETGETVKRIDLGSADSQVAKPAGPGVQGPFGFERGMTRAQVIALVGKDAVDSKDSQGDSLWLYTAPKPHPAFDSYLLSISPEHGLLRIVGSGKTIEVGDAGSDLKEAFDTIVKAVAQKYGKPTDTHDFCTGGAECDSERFWMMSLQDKNRVLSTVWVLDANPVNEVKAISVQAKALSINKGYVVYACEFEGWSQYVDEKRAKQNANF